MNAVKRLVSVVVILFIMGIFANKPAHATASNIFFAINDTIQKDGPGPLNIEGTYTVNGETITIAPYGGNAIIEYDEAGDWLRMKNVEITSSTAPLDNVKFSFWRTFGSLRVGTVTYSISGSGYFSRSTSAADPINWISARGYVEGTVLGSVSPDNLTSPPPNPPTCTLKLTSCATNLATTWTFNLNIPNGGLKVSHNFGSGGTPQLGAASDDLKAEFWIHLEKTTDRLDITAAPGIRIKYGPPGGEDPDGCPEAMTGVAIIPDKLFKEKAIKKLQEEKMLQKKN